jgi:hypothetical protein
MKIERILVSFGPTIESAAALFAVRWIDFLCMNLNKLAVGMRLRY